MKATAKKAVPEFQPIEVTLRIESKDELDMIKQYTANIKNTVFTQVRNAIAGMDRSVADEIVDVLDEAKFGRGS